MAYPEQSEWWMDFDTVHSVASYGVLTHAFDSFDELLYFFEKPWRFEELHEEYGKVEPE